MVTERVIPTPPTWGLPILHQETHGVPNLLGETGEMGDFCSLLSSKIWCFTTDSALTNQRTAKNFTNIGDFIQMGDIFFFVMIDECQVLNRQRSFDP